MLGKKLLRRHCTKEDSCKDQLLCAIEAPAKPVTATYIVLSHHSQRLQEQQERKFPGDHRDGESRDRIKTGVRRLRCERVWEEFRGQELA